MSYKIQVFQMSKDHNKMEKEKEQNLKIQVKKQKKKN